MSCYNHFLKWGMDFWSYLFWKKNKNAKFLNVRKFVTKSYMILYGEKLSTYVIVLVLSFIKSVWPVCEKFIMFSWKDF